MHKVWSRVLPVVVFAQGTGCLVSKARYDEIDSALHVESEAHRKTSARLYEIEQKLANLSALLAEREQRLAQNEQQLAERDLNQNRADHELHASEDVVEQLRNDLARVGAHLRVFSEQKATLEDALDAAEQRAKGIAAAERNAARSALLLRDLSRELRQPLGKGEVELDVDLGWAVVKAQGAATDSQELLSALARVAKLHPGSSVVVSERGKAAPDQSGPRLKRLVEALVAQGLEPKRVQSELSVEQKAASSEQSARDAEAELERAVAAAEGTAPAAPPAAPGATEPPASEAPPAAPADLRFVFAFEFDD